jgi:DNA-binding transcriptional LysR family regulator
MALDLEAVRAFTKVAELASFTRAGAHLNVSKSRVSLLVSALERELGVGLLQRSTRAVFLTADGEQFVARARRLLAEADELGAMFEARRVVRGQVRADLPIKLACQLVIPRLPEFLAQNPEIEVKLSTTDRRVDVLRDGLDCVLRVGPLVDSGLSARRLGAMNMINCASPLYLRRRGTPRVLADLDGHEVVHYSIELGSDAPSFEYREGERYRERPMQSSITVNNADAYTAACLAGFGIIQVPRWGMAQYLGSGALVEVLPELTCAPMPVSILHAYARNVPKRVRLFMAWLAELVVPQLG